MSDLIDRRGVVNWLENYKFENYAGVGHEKEYNFIENLIKGILNEPTAYDVEQVVKELEEKKHNFSGGTLQSFYYWRGIDEAIEIVKGGGVNEIKN